MSNMDYYEVTFSSSEIKTVQDYLVSELCPITLPPLPETGRGEVINRFATKFLSWSNGKTNEERIKGTYTAKERKDNLNKSPETLLLKPGVKFVIPQGNVNRAGLINQGLQITYTNEPVFKASELAKLEQDKGYVRVDSQKLTSIAEGSVKQYYPDITVWVWCRALTPNNPIPQSTSPFLDEMKGEFIDLSPFIEKCSTSLGKNGGNFEFSLPPLVAEFGVDGKWSVKKTSIKSVLNNISNKTEYYASESFFKQNLQLNKLERNQFLFHNIISSNDLVFIRFETLDIESEQRSKEVNNFTLNKEKLSGNIYDLIGLVDSNSITYSPNNNTVSINVQGRDLSKIFIEDGTYFYSLENSQGKANFLGGSTNALSQRLFIDNNLQFINLYYNNSIENIFKFVIEQISNIGVVPNDLFTSYKNKNTKYKSIPQNSIQHTKLIEGYKTQAQTYLRSLRKKYDIQFKINGVVNNDGEGVKINTLHNQLKDFLTYIRQPDAQKKVVRISATNKTTGWATLNYLEEVVKPNYFPHIFDNQIYPFSGDGIKLPNIELSVLIGYIDNEIDTDKNPSFQPQLIKVNTTGVWQIINLVLDEKVSNRRLVDSSISSSQGSLLNFFKKACQDPFVEYYSDTYSDTYNLIIRRPPINKEGVISLLEGKVRTENGTYQTATIDIEEIDVIQESLSFDDNEVYSWYHLTPQASMTGGTEIYSTAYLPALYFPEYAEIWGSKPMDVVSNYIPYIPLDNKNEKLSTELKQNYIDLAFLVESSAHLPFTRKGTITLNGDRRIKIGNMIRYKPTGEIFLVEAVSQSYSINEGTIERVTTVQVKRGMVEQLIYGVDLNIAGKIKRVSYFNIINTQLNFNETKPFIVTKTERVKNPKYDSTVPTETSDADIDQTVPDAELSPFYFGDLKKETKLIGKNLQQIAKLDSSVQSVFTQFLLKVQEMNYTVLITDSRRSYAQQLNQYFINPGQYNYKPPTQNSPHIKGYALDINIINNKNGIVYRKNTSKTSWISTGIPDLAKSLGLFWGGNFSTVDTVHFQFKGTPPNGVDKNGNQEFMQKEINSVIYIPDETKILKNFIVDRDIFSFFLRKQQVKYANVNFVNRIK